MYARSAAIRAVSDWRLQISEPSPAWLWLGYDQSRDCLRNSAGLGDYPVSDRAKSNGGFAKCARRESHAHRFDELSTAELAVTSN
jgi:hypothetical protein